MWTSRLRNMMGIPDGFNVMPAKGKWNGVYKHTGKDSYTPLKQSLSHKHISGLYTILSGALIWMSARIEGKADTRVLDELAEALFCYQQDPLYYSSSDTRPYQDDIDAADRFLGPILYIRDEWFDYRKHTSETWGVYPPHNMIGRFLELSRYVVGPEAKDIFDPWIKETIERMDILVPFPGHSDIPDNYSLEERPLLAQTSMGPPLPPNVLDRSATPNPAEFPTRWAEFLTTVDWKNNRFLRSPEGMIAMGATFEPYRHSR